MANDDREYFRQRALDERKLARAATNPTAIQAHEELAKGYEALVRQEEANDLEQRPSLRK